MAVDNLTDWKPVGGNFKQSISVEVDPSYFDLQETQKIFPN